MWRRKSGTPGGVVAFAVLCVVCLALFTVYVREGNSGPLHTVQLGATEVLRPVRSAVATAARPVESAAGAAGNLFDENREEEVLRRERQRSEGLAAQNARLTGENERLRRLLEGEREPYEYAPLARVVAPVGAQFTDRLVINVGSEDGVEPEQPVVVGNNTLVGRTTERVSASTAEVMLVTDRSFAAGVRIVPPGEFDVFSGEITPPEPTTPESTSLETTTSGGAEPESTTSSTGEPGGRGSTAEGLFNTADGGYLGVDFVELSDRVRQEDFVVTSGRAGEFELLFPPGLLVGMVESVSSQDIEQYKKIVVAPAVPAEELEEVRVITAWES